MFNVIITNPTAVGRSNGSYICGIWNVSVWMEWMNLSVERTIETSSLWCCFVFSLYVFWHSLFFFSISMYHSLEVKRMYVSQHPFLFWIVGMVMCWVKGHTARIGEEKFRFGWCVFFLGFIYSVFVWFSLFFVGEKPDDWGRLNVEFEGLWVWFCFI